MRKKYYLADSVDDLVQIDTAKLTLGDQCYVIQSRELYSVNSKKEWQLIGTSTSYTPIHTEPSETKKTASGTYIEYTLDSSYNVIAAKINEMPAILKYGFFSQQQLDKIDIPEGVKEIQDYAFQNCTKLTKVNLPSSLTKIGYNSFAFCSEITEIRFKSTVTSLSNTTFSSCTSLTDIYVPWQAGKVSGAPWSATKATIHYES